MAHEIAVVVADVADAILDVQSSPLLTATTGSAAQGMKDGSFHPDVPTAVAKGDLRGTTTTVLCIRRGGEAD